MSITTALLIAVLLLLAAVIALGIMLWNKQVEIDKRTKLIHKDSLDGISRLDLLDIKRDLYGIQSAIDRGRKDHTHHDRLVHVIRYLLRRLGVEENYMYSKLTMFGGVTTGFNLEQLITDLDIEHCEEKKDKQAKAAHARLTKTPKEKKA